MLHRSFTAPTLSPRILCQSQWPICYLPNITFNFLTSTTLLYPFPMVGIITSLLYEVKSWAARLSGGWQSWLPSLDQTWQEMQTCVPKRELLISPLQLPSWVHPNSWHHPVAQARNPQVILVPSTLSLNLGPFFQFATAGPVDSAYEIYLKAIHFSSSVLFPLPPKPPWPLAPTTAMAS